MDSQKFLKEMVTDPLRMKGMLIEFNGRKYAGLDKMPPAEQAAFLQVIQAGQNQVIFQNQIEFNGRTYQNPDQMSAEDRKLYEATMQMVRSKPGGRTSLNFDIQFGNRQPAALTPTRMVLYGIFALVAVLIWIFRDWFIQ